MNVVFKSDDPKKLEEQYLRWQHVKSPRNEVYIAASTSFRLISAVVTLRPDERVLQKFRGVRLLSLDEFRTFQKKVLEEKAVAQ